MGRAKNDETWNFSVNLLDITFITLGFSLISRETVIPVLVSQLTDSKMAIGLVPSLWSLGMFLPQLMTANLAERMEYKKPFIITIGLFIERLPYLLIGFLVFAFAQSSPTVALVAILAGVGLASSGAGIATPAWLDMIAKVIPVNRRGVWAGLGHGLGQLMGVVGAIFVGRILTGLLFPNNYALLFVLAFGFMALSWGGISLTREPPSAKTKEDVPLFSYLRRVSTLVGRDHNYRRYLVSKSLVNIGGMSAGFYAVYGTQLFDLDGQAVGLLTAFLVGAQALMNPLWGLLADRVGHKTVLAAGAFFITLAPLCALLAGFLPGLDAVTASGAASAGTQSGGFASNLRLGGVPFGLLLAFVFLGGYLAADNTSSLNIILEFCAPEDRPTYVGLTNTVLAPVLIGAPLVGGWLSALFGFQAMFGIALVFAAIACILMLFWVREPRRSEARIADGPGPAAA